MRRVLRAAERYAAKDVILLIEGETGTGKSLLARHLHQCSPRAAQPYHEVALSALDDALAASDLFGHREGAFTDAKERRLGAFVVASGGTLFLDEIAKASSSVQRKLLVALETQRIRPLGADRDVPVNVRVIAASNIPLADLVAQERFLPDLYARLEAFRIELPPLRERRDDIPTLVRHFVANHAHRFAYPGGVPAVDAALLHALERADWPGNVRQLDGVMQRLLVDAGGAPVLGLAHVADELRGFLEPKGRRPHGESGEPLRLPVANKAKAARILGISRTTLYRRLAKEQRRCEGAGGSEDGQVALDGDATADGT
jgi:two-component system response regulator HydG